MDFHSMKRKELQSLCKKHNIPANLTNLEMANDLTSLLQGKEKPIRRGRSCLKKVGDLASENDSDAVTRQLKKVRFSPENEMFEFVELEAEPAEMKRGARRKSIMRPEVKKQSFVIENKEIVENPIRTTRSRTQKFSTGGVIEVVLPIVEAKRTKRVVKSDSLEVKESVSGDNLPPVVDLSDKLEENRVATIKSLRNREVQSKKSKEIDKDVKPYGETVENPVRTTRSRAQKLPDGGVIEVVLPIVETKRTKRAVKSGCMEEKDGVSGDKPPAVVDSSDNLASDSTAVEENRVPTGRSLRNREVVSKKSKGVDEVVAISRKNQTQRNSKKRNVETTDEISENNALAADGGITQPEKALRWSKRNVEKVEDYALLNQDLGKNEMVGRRRNTRCRTQLAENASTAESGTRTETEVEVHGKLEVVLQLEEPSRRPVRNGNRRQSVMPQVEKAGTDGAKLENKNRKLLRPSVMEGGSSSKNLEENDGRPRRSSRHEIVAISDEMDRTANNNGKIKPRKSRRDPILEEESVVNESAFVEEPPRWSACNAAKTDTVALTVGTDKTVGRKKQPSRLKLPNLELESLAKGTSAVKEPPILDAQLSMPGIAESAIDPVLNDNTGKKRKKFSGTSLAKEVSAETSDFEEATALKMVNSVEIPASEPGKLQNDHGENEVLFSVSGSEVVEKVYNAVGVDNISTVNEHDSASHSCKRSRDFDTNDLVEPKTAEDFNVFADVGFPQATFGDDWIHCVVKPADNLDLGKEMERDEKPGTGKYIDLCCVVDQHGVDDDKAYAPKEQKSVEFENVNSFGESIKTDLDAEGLLDESIESRVSKENSETVCEEAGESVVDHSDSERVIYSKEKDREIDEDEKSVVDAEGEEYANCCPRMLNIEAESLLTKHISAFKGPPVTDSVMTEPEVSEGASNPALSSSKKVSEYTNIERKGSSEDSSLKMQHHSMGLHTKSPYLNEIRGLIMENLEGTPASNSLKLQSDSAEPEREIPDSESLAATEKENIVLVAGNRNFTEFQEVCGFAEPSTYERVCEGHSIGPDESEGTGEDCENDSKKAADISVLDDPSSHGERITPNMVEKNNNKAESSVESGKLHEKVLVSDVVTAEVVSEKVTNFQLTSGYCSMGTQLTPLIASEYQGNTNHVELKENSNYDTEFHYGILSAADTFASTAGDKICCQERIDEASPEMKNKSEGILSVERALHPVDEETDHESLEGNSLRKCSFLPILSELNGQLTEKKENTGSETNSLHNSEEIEDKITSKFTDGKMSLIISVERDTDPTEDTHAPINTPKSSLVVNNEIMSSSEHTSLKDVNESGQEDGLKALFATPDNNTFSNEEEASDHELCQTPSKSNLVMKDKSSEFTESTVNGGAAAEDAQTDVNSLLAESNGRRGSKENSKNVCEEAGDTLAPIMTPKSSLVVNNEIMSSSEHMPLKDDNENIQEDELKSLFATPANNTNPNEEEACSREIECDEVRMQEGSTISNVKNERNNSGEPQEVVGLTENEDEKMACKENALPTFSEEVTDEGSDGNEEVEGAQELNKSASTALDNLANRKGDEDLVEILKFFEGAVLTKDTPALINTPKSSLVVNNELISSSECTPLKYDNESIQEDELKTMFATPANSTNPNEEEASSHETEMDDVRMQESSSFSNVNDMTNFGEPQEVELTENEDEKLLSTASEEVTDKGSDGNEDVEMVQELDKSASTASDKLADRKGDEDLVDISNKFEGVVPQVDGMKFNNLTGDKIEIVQDLDKGAFLTSHEFGSAGHEHGEDLKERSSVVAGSKVQVEGMKLDDFDSNKDFKIMGRNLNIKDKDTDADKEVSPGYSNRYSEHEKVCLPLNVSDFDGNAPTFLDKSFPDNADITKETIVDDMVDNVSSDATDGSNVEENVKSSQILLKEQLLGNEDAVEEDAFKGDISCLASNETNIIPEEADAMHWSFSNNFNDMVHCAVESNEYAEQQNISLASASTPEVNDDCAAVSPYGLASVHGTMGYGASELSLESNMFSSWEINMFLGDEGMKSTAGISETHFTCEDTVIASVKKENAEQLGKHSNLMEEKVEEINGSCFVSDESNYCRYSENKSVEVEKSSDSMHGVILTDVYNNKGSEYAATVDLTVGGEFKCPREENTDNTVVEEAKSLVEGHKCKEMVGEETELCEAVTKSNSTIEGQSFKLTVSAVDGETSAEDAQLWQPNSEIVIVKNPLAKAEEGDFAVKHLNSTMMKMKNDRNKLIQETPKKRITALDMKENETAIKRDHVGSISVRSTAKRRALEDLRNK
ncbi:hypothetical protein ACSBR2_029675 [Camellia fascicularis]